MNTQELSGYLSRLLGRPIASNDLVALSSGQRARFSAWLAERGIPVARSRALLGATFRPSIFFGESTTAPQEAVDLAPDTSSLAALADSGSALRIGIDIQRIDELFDADAASDLKANAELKSIFSLREISYAQSRPHPLDTLAGLFAAKESLRKCGPALLHRSLSELEVLPDSSGKPEFPGYAVSISHSGGFAIAVAAASSVPPRQNGKLGANEIPVSDPPPPESSPMKRSGRLKAAIVTAAVVLTFILLGGGMLRSLGVGR